MGAVLSAGLAIGGDCAGIVIGHHNDEAGAEDHQEGKQVAHPLGFHDTAARRHHWGKSTPAVTAVDMLSVLLAIAFRSFHLCGRPTGRHVARKAVR